eukprot:5641213-Amphidinium_carterae.1
MIYEIVPQLLVLDVNVVKNVAKKLLVLNCAAYCASCRVAGSECLSKAVLHHELLQLCHWVPCCSFCIVGTARHSPSVDFCRKVRVLNPRFTEPLRGT